MSEEQSQTTEIDRLKTELEFRKRQQVIMYSCLESIQDGRDFEGCKRAANLALIAVRQITSDLQTAQQRNRYDPRRSGTTERG